MSGAVSFCFGTFGFRSALAVFMLCMLCTCTGPAPQGPSSVQPGAAKPELRTTLPEHELALRLADQARTNAPALLRAIEESLAYVRTRLAHENPLGQHGAPCSWAALQASLEHLRAVLPVLDADLLIRDFVWLEMAPQPLLTGYYEPEMEGSLCADPRFPVPLHGLPSELRTVDLGQFHPRWQGQTLICRLDQDRIVPFYTRHEIDSRGALNATSPIAWIRDPVDAFFLHIQGSGRLRLEDGRVVHVLYAGKNGHEYVSLGKVLIERGLVPREEMSMQRIRACLAERPEQVRELLDTNPSYVFFRLAEHGPLGAMGRTLTPLVSVATDSAFLPLGGILAVQVSLPDADRPAAPSAFLALAQDRGGAIKGSRLDVFCGAGKEAEFLAGHLQERGRVFLLLKKDALP